MQIAESEGNLTRKIKETEENLKQMVESKLSDLETRVLALEGSDQRDMMSEVHEELRQLETRKKNIAVFGVEEGEEEDETDERVVGKLLEEIEASAAFQCYRTGPKVTGRQQTLII